MTMTSQRRNPPVPIYSTYATFERVIDELHQRGLPPRLDLHAVSSMPPDPARRVLSGFKTIGWMDENGVPSADLRAIVETRNTEAWQQTLRAALHKAYPFVPDDWEQLTSSKLAAAFREYTGRDNQAVKAAQTFFIAAAYDAGVALPPVLAARAEKTRSDNSVNFGFRKSDSRAVRSGEQGRTKGGLNGGAEPVASSDAQVWSLVALIDEGDMTDKEKNAVLTLLAYLKRRRAGEQRRT